MHATDFLFCKTPSKYAGVRQAGLRPVSRFAQSSATMGPCVKPCILNLEDVGSGDFVAQLDLPTGDRAVTYVLV